MPGDGSWCRRWVPLSRDQAWSSRDLDLVSEVGTIGAILTVLGWIEDLAKGDALCILFPEFLFLFFILWKEKDHSGPSYIELGGALNVLFVLFNVHTQFIEYHCSHLTDRWQC